MVRFTASSVLALLVLLVGTVLLGARIAEEEGLRDARLRGAAIAHLIAAPLVNADVRAQIPGAATELTMVMGNRMSDGSVLHAKLWNTDGQIIWADQKNLVGRRFPMTPDVKALFGTTNATAKITDLTAPGPRAPEHGGEQEVLPETLEVYAGTRDSDQQPMVFEASFTNDRMRQDRAAIINGFLPIVITALLLFQFAVLPMALSLARRVERGQVERSRWMRHALLASDLERRRIAQDLHDGVIQDLAGLSYVIPTLQTQFADHPPTSTARQTTTRISEILTRDVAALRTMITDIYPPDLQGPGLATAITDLTRASTEHAITVDLHMPPHLTLPLDTARLTYRVIREGLRNITKHAHASTATITITTHKDHLDITITDNGQGLPPGPATTGHLGLRLLEDTVADFGGTLTLQSTPPTGATLHATFPTTLIQP